MRSLTPSATGLLCRAWLKLRRKKAPSNGRGFLYGTSGRTRTATAVKPGDFESPMSTNFITLALNLYPNQRVVADEEGVL